MPAVNGVGEPCAGEPHARFEVAGTGNGADLAKDTGVAQPAGKPAGTKAPGPKASEPPRQSPTLQQLLADHLVLELHQNQDGLGDVADRGRADHDVLQGAPPLRH